MMIDATKLVFDHCCAFEIMANGEFVCDADAAMRLHGILSDKFAGPPDFGFGLADRCHAFIGWRVDIECRHDRHGPCLLNLHEHIDHTVLQHLESADRLAKLLALLRIFQRAFMQFCRHAAGFCADRNGCFIDNLFNQRQASAFVAKQRITGDRNIFEIYFRRAKTMDSRGGRCRRHSHRSETATSRHVRCRTRRCAP